MLTATESMALVAAPLTSGSPMRRPLVPVALAAIAGIVADAYCPLGASFWLLTLFGAWACWLIGARRSVPPAVSPAAGAARGWLRAVAARCRNRAGGPSFFLYLAAAALFAAWHDNRTRDFPPNDIGNYVLARRQICRLRGCVDAEPTVESTEKPDAVLWAFPKVKTRFILQVDELATDNGWANAEGRTAVSITGALEDLPRGTRVELVGWLSTPAGTANPGEFDYAQHLLAQRIRATLACEHPEALVRLEAPDWSWQRVRDEVRAAAGSAFRRRLDPKLAALADALVLGKRAAIDRDELAPFLESGAMHLLVVSGLHLVILTALIWNSLGILSWTVPRRAIAVLMVIVGYALLTGADAPVVRAAVVVGAYLVGFIVCRPVEPLNSLAAAALVVLTADPTDLFRGGPQLSFIAVLAIHGFGSKWLAAGASAGSDDPVLSSGSIWRSCCRALAQGMILSLVIWLVSAPLLLYRFHLFTPVSVLVSPPLVLLVDGILGLAPVYLALSWLPDVFLAPIGWLLAGLLRLLVWGVEAADRVPFGFAYLPAPPGWWVLGLYIVLFLPWCFTGGRPRKRTYAAANIAWSMAGLLAVVWPAGSATGSLTQLAVGHGNCTVLRLPGGGTILYDCGSLSGPLVAERTIAPFLWAQGIGALDAVFLSHADLDHYNGLGRLARRFRIGQVFVTPQFAAGRAPPVELVTAELQRRRIPIALTWAGDRFTMGGAVLEVLEPPAEVRGESDNADSLVLRCTFDGYTMLLTGDISGSGLDRLLRRPPEPIDLLAAPHHGSRASNPPHLADWARPRIVISSQARPRSLLDPLAAYAEGGALVLRTDEHGAITCRPTPLGIQLSTHLGGHWLLSR